MNQFTVFIPARGGSKGLPNKNIKELAGKPLLVHTIEYALNSKLVNEVVVSTDNSKIAEIAKNAGSEIIIRPDNLSTDTATTESAISHYLNNCKQPPENIILLQVTSPIRPQNSLDEAINKFLSEKYDTLLTISPTHRFGWRIKDDQSIYPDYNYKNRPRRQDLTSLDQKFIENGSLYIFSYSHFIKTGNRLGGKIGYLIWPEEYSLEIDTPLDFQFIELIYKELYS